MQKKSDLEIIRCREKALSHDETTHLTHVFLSKNDEHLENSVYFNRIRQDYVAQLEAKTRGASHPLIKERAQDLTRHFLKRKLGLISPVEKIKYTGTLFDPHHHLNSIYVSDNQDLKLSLPNFDYIYVALRQRTKSSTLETQFINDSTVIKDVQFFGYPPSTTHSTQNVQTIYKTYGYLRGGSLNYASHGDSADYCGEEYDYDGRDVQRYLDSCARVRTIRFHMGETVIPAQGRENVENLFQQLRLPANRAKLTNKTLRIGHGTHMSIDSMQECALQGYFVECCLSSNKETGILAKRHQYPLAVFMLMGVRVVIGTDGGDVYSSDLRSEYGYAEKNLARFRRKIDAGCIDPVTLINGDTLLFRQLRHLFTDVSCYKDDAAVSYADLATLDNITALLSLDTLLENMSLLQERITGTKPVISHVAQKHVKNSFSQALPPASQALLPVSQALPPASQALLPAPKALSRVTSSPDRESLFYSKQYCTEIKRSGSRKQVAGRRHLNGQQVLIEVQPPKYSNEFLTEIKNSPRAASKPTVVSSSLPSCVIPIPKEVESPLNRSTASERTTTPKRTFKKAVDPKSKTTLPIKKEAISSKSKRPETVSAHWFIELMCHPGSVAAGALLFAAGMTGLGLAIFGVSVVGLPAANILMIAGGIGAVCGFVSIATSTTCSFFKPSLAIKKPVNAPSANQRPAP